MSVTPAQGPSQPSQATGATGSTGEDTKLWLLKAAKVLVVLVYAFVLVNLVLLIMGFFLQLFGASTDAEFTQWVYRNIDRIMDPFRGIFPTHDLTDQSVLDTSLLFAMVVYTIVGIALHALVAWLTDKIVLLRRRQRFAMQQEPRPTDRRASEYGPYDPGTANRRASEYDQRDPGTAPSTWG